MWFCAVRSDDLDKPGAFKTVQVGRESVLITRSRKRRGARVFQTSAGISGAQPAHRGEVAKSSAHSNAVTTLGLTTSTESWWPHRT